MAVLDYRGIRAPGPKIRLDKEKVRELGLVGDEVILFRKTNGKIHMTIHET